MNAQFNKITGWLGTIITACPNIKIRRKIIAHFINVVIKLLHLRNYSGLMAVYIGLTQNPVSRMTQTWKGLPVEDLMKWEKLETLCSPLGNFKNLRLLHESPDIPSIKSPTIFLRDLIFLEDGNEDTIQIQIDTKKKKQKKRSYWNLTKIQLIGRLIDNIQISQNSTYDLVPIPSLLVLLTQLEFIDRTTQEELSRRNEPTVKDDD